MESNVYVDNLCAGSTPFCTTLMARVKYLRVLSRLRSLYNLCSRQALATANSIHAFYVHFCN